MDIDLAIQALLEGTSVDEVLGNIARAKWFISQGQMGTTRDTKGALRLQKLTPRGYADVIGGHEGYGPREKAANMLGFTRQGETGHASDELTPMQRLHRRHLWRTPKGGPFLSG
jgi:hypothetical protein